VKTPNRDHYKIELPLVNAPYWWANDSPDSMAFASARSHGAWRKAVHKIAGFFEREFGYDASCSGEAFSGVNRHDDAAVWVADDKAGDIVFGAALFRQSLTGWSMQWAWIHPFERNKGWMARAWPFFQRRYKKLTVDGPLSPAMRAFLKKYDPEEAKRHE